MKKLVKGFASVILASMFVFIGCKPPTSTSEPPSGGSEPTGQSKITITVQGDEHVEKVEPATLSVAKGEQWSAVKSRIKVTYKNGFVNAGWKVNGADLTDDYPFEKDTTVYALSKEAVTITVKGDEHVNNIITTTLSVAKGSTWSAVKSRIKVTYKNGYGEKGWKDADDVDLTDDYRFEKDTTVFAVSKEVITITVSHDAGVEKVEPATLVVAKGSTWSSVKSGITPTYKTGFVEAGWKVTDKNGADLTDDYQFNSDTTVFAVSKEVITITVQGDSGIEIPTENTFTVDKDTKWGDIKTTAKAKIRVKENYALFEWRLNDEIGDVITTDDLIFTGSATVFAVSKEAVKITIAHDAGVEKVEPATLSVAKGSTWSAIKSQIRVTPKTGFVEAGWKLDNASGTVLTDNYQFNSDTTVFAVSKEVITITVSHDAGVEKVEPATLVVAKGSTWSSVKSGITPTYKTGFVEAGWKLDSASGTVLTDDYQFNSDTTVFACSEKLPVITIAHDAGVEKVEPTTLVVAKGSTWSSVKSGITPTYKDGFVEAGWKLDNASGTVLPDDYQFNSDTTVYACSEKLPVITIAHDAGVEKVEPATLFVAKGSTWSTIKSQIRVTPKTGFVEAGWKLDNASGTVLPDDYQFNSDTTVYACSEKLPVITIAHDAGVEKVEPATLFVAKGSTWSSVKSLITPTYKDGFVEASWKLDNASGTILTYDYQFNSDTTVYACSKKQRVTITVKGDERIETSQQIEIFNGNYWGSIKRKIEIQPSADWKDDWNKGDYAVHEWRLGGENGEKISDDYCFTDDTVVYAVSNYVGWSIYSNELRGYNSRPRGKIIIPASVTSIREKVFKDCRDLKSITLPEGVTSIKEYTFSGCSSLESITIPASLTSIWWGAFSDCSSLKTITLPKDLTSINKYTFSGCSSLESITIPASVKSINDRAFAGCSSLKTITLPKNLTWIEEYAFVGCTGLTSITIPESVKSINDWAFADCTGLTSITIPESVKSINRGVFSGCSGLTSITIPEGVTEIVNYAFEGCSSLASITLPEGVKIISASTFARCSSLESISIPEHVTEINKEAFKDCSNLKSITIPKSVKSIGELAFDGCSSLASATFMAPYGWEDSDYQYVDVSTNEAAIKALKNGGIRKNN